MDLERFLWTFGLVLLVVVLAGLLVLGWRRRARSQQDIPALPAVPPEFGADLAEPLEGVYVATTRSGAWQDRVVVHTLGRRAKADLRVSADGVLIDRVGESPIWLPASAITLVGTAPGIAGKVMGLADGILMISWRNGNRLLDTGFRAEDPDLQQDWIAAARTLIVSAGDFHAEETSAAGVELAEGTAAETSTEPPSTDVPRKDGAQS